MTTPQRRLALLIQLRDRFLDDGCRLLRHGGLISDEEINALIEEIEVLRSNIPSADDGGGEVIEESPIG